MANRPNNGKKAQAQRAGPVRCAIYTRKSTTEGLDSDFNTLDAQREAAEHYVKSQAAAGWVEIETRYDDGGFTGGNLDRPALTRLMDDIDRGEVDMVVVYKVDRLSRSLLDFARLMARFEARSVGFVSITQHFDTSTSMGRLVLNILLSFAQFERELISERTRDKVQAARRRGKWTGGHVVLGYDLDPKGSGLVVVPEEAEVVRLIFGLYLRHRSIGAVARKLNAQGFTQKRRVSRKQRVSGGMRWDKKAVYRVLRNPVFAGRMRGDDGRLHASEHEAIVSLEDFERAGASLGARAKGRAKRERSSAYLLRGLLRCGACDAAMTSASARGRKGRTYRYYRCTAENDGRQPCPTGLLPATKVEDAVVEQLGIVARSQKVQRRILDALASDSPELTGLEAGRERITAQLAERKAEGKRLLAAFRDGEGGRLAAERLGELEAEMDSLRGQLEGVEAQIRGVLTARQRLDDIARVLDSFDEVWRVLLPEERRELMLLIVAGVTADHETGSLRIALHDLDRPLIGDHA